MDIGGTEQVTHDLINEYVSEGFNVFLFCLRKTGAFLNELLIPKENIYEVAGGGVTAKGVFKVAYKLSKLLRKTKTDYFISMGEWPNIISPFVNFNGKFAIVEHSTKSFFSDPDEYHLSLSIKKISKIAYQKAPKIFCVSQNIKNILVSKNKSFAAKTEVIYNPIDFETINKLAREEIDYNSKKIKIISVCRFSKPKNLPLLLQAFSEVHKDISDIELWLVGDGEQREDLEEMAKSLGILDSVVFWGFQVNPYKYISKADLFVLSSYYEGFSLTTYEALFLKKRIIATKCNSDLCDFVTSDYGQIISVDNKAELIKALKEEITNRKTIDKIPEMVTRFSVKAIAENYLNI